MIARLPKIALWLALALLVWFAVAVFGPKFGLIDWRVGLGTMIMDWGAILVGIVALVALVAQILCLVKGPRSGWWRAALALAIPLAIFAGLLSVRARGESVPPIHDVATDTADPPQFSAETLARREEWGANPIDDYDTPLGQIDMWAERLAGDPMADMTHAQIIAEDYGDLRPITYAADDADPMAAVAAAMMDIGLTDIRSDVAEGRVEGTAETFAFGFRDDVVARVRNGQIDLRSTSRVGVSDLGYNADRLRELSKAIEARLAE